MIFSFGDAATEDLYHGNNTARVRSLPQDVRARALDKLDILDAATSLEDLRAPPSNHLEKLTGNLAGYHSIRVNKQWRIAFRWDGGAHEVRLLDYH
jgi:toxin HigB-1